MGCFSIASDLASLLAFCCFTTAEIWAATVENRLGSSTRLGVAEGAFAIDGFGATTVILPQFTNLTCVAVQRDRVGGPPMSC